MGIIKIDIYGGMNLSGGGCGCGCTSCTLADAKAEYEETKKVLLEKYGEETIALEFIDTGVFELSDFPEVEKVIQTGYSFPVTVINGVPRLAGAISSDSIIGVITEIQTKE